MIRQLILPIIFLTALTACRPSYGPPLETECKSQTYTIQVSLVTQDAVHALYLDNGGTLRSDEQVLGFSAVDRSGKPHIVSVAPAGQNDHEAIETLGHELLHVMCGSWHAE